ncbi:glycine hydroxymethyltransferase [Pseudonocardia asaccharolytica]|uniref:Serine hydroxymethyltransferase n=1 Tax=Pseudonocardia asaccharolytica DSM 44247 = NBRC 16224 TaxID=1123024 RepID=A0A511D8U4_9PSEU|nr:glycine hydroxymethyltransferase [Pseudonocardia asaccharolytica]GEL20823.1 serine hydroxymethyltransferase [Pseudonocardia asaccharolytica DSM 44247 = NBRC 16224]
MVGVPEVQDPTLASAALRRYVASTPPELLDPAAIAFFGALDAVGAALPDIASSIAAELGDQRSNIKLIASENYSSLAVQLAQGTLLTDKYAEGVPGHRFYAGCDNVDAIERRAADLARKVFGADHAYVQPHSGADANLVAFLAVLSQTVEAPTLARLGHTNLAELPEPAWEALRREIVGQRLLGMDLYSGGHLTHGYRHNVSARLFEAHSYTVDRETGFLDFDTIVRQARALRPRILMAGYSAYPRRIDFARFRELADEIGAAFVVDMAHFAGLVAGKVFTGVHDPVPHAHIVTTTTHKTLRGPRGGMVLCSSEYADAIDKGCPLVLGGPLPHAIAAKAVALHEAGLPDFGRYAHAVVDNARELADRLRGHGGRVVTGGTENHLVLLDVATSYGLTGRQAESALRSCGLTLNRNALAFDPNGPWYASGLRLGTAAVTTLGMGAAEMHEIAGIIHDVLTPAQPVDGSRARFDLPDSAVAAARARVAVLLDRHPLYPEIDLGLLAPGVAG